MADALQTVTFQAKTTNSAPPQPGKPKARSNDGPVIIAVFNSVGLIWVLWENAPIAFLAAACIGAISLAMRKSRLAQGISLVASSVVAYALISHPPTLPSRGYHWHPAGAVQEDWGTQIGLYAAAALLLGMVHRIAGEPDAVEFPAPVLPVKAQEDPEAILKKKGFDPWLKGNIALGGETTLAVDAAYDDYKKSLPKHPIPPPSYSLPEFKAAFKTATGREAIDIKGVPSYQGVSFVGGGLL